MVVVCVLYSMHFLISLMIACSAFLNADGDPGVAAAMISCTLAASDTPKQPCVFGSSGISWRMYSNNEFHFRNHRPVSLVDL